MDRYDALALLGVVCASIGMGMIYAPLGLVVFGVCLIGGALLGARTGAMNDGDRDARQEHSGMTKDA